MWNSSLSCAWLNKGRLKYHRLDCNQAAQVALANGRAMHVARSNDRLIASVNGRRQSLEPSA
jgi:hypothetical protein